MLSMKNGNRVVRRINFNLRNQLLVRYSCASFRNIENHVLPLVAYSSFKIISGDKKLFSSFKEQVVLESATIQEKDICKDGTYSTEKPSRLSKIPLSTTAFSTLPTSKAYSPTVYFDLAKGKLSVLIVTTTAVGFLAAGGPISLQFDVLASCIAGTALCSASAAAWNQVLEIEQDKRMKRTQRRVLVTGELTKGEAVLAASVWGVAGGSVLLAGTDAVTAALGVGNIFLYAGVYTYMKPRSIYNTWVGAVVGAIPPVIGWSAATGGSLFQFEPLLLASTLYLWQMPHFFALSYMHRIDYKRGGFQMVPCLEEDGKQTAGIMMRYASYLAAVPLVATATGLTSSMFAFEGIALNAYAMSVAYKFQRERTNANARKVFLTSLWYLPSLLMLYLLHSKVWDEEKVASDDTIAVFLANSIKRIREKGRELCIHETAVARTDNGEEACPITVGSKKSRETVETAVAAAAKVKEATLENSTKVVE